MGPGSTEFVKRERRPRQGGKLKTPGQGGMAVFALRAVSSGQISPAAGVGARSRNGLPDGGTNAKAIRQRGTISPEGHSVFS